MKPALVVSNRAHIRYSIKRILDSLHLSSTVMSHLLPKDSQRWADAPLILLDAADPATLDLAQSMPCRDQDVEQVEVEGVLLDFPRAELTKTESVILLFDRPNEEKVAFQAAQRLGATYIVRFPYGQDWLVQNLILRRDALIRQGR